MRLLETPYYTLDLDPPVPLVIFRRRDVPYPSAAAIDAEAKRIEHALGSLGSKRYQLLVDMRPIHPRNDPEFEKAIISIRQQLVRRAHRIVILVRTATGSLQVQRHIRDDGLEARVMHDEHEALAYLLHAEGDSAVSGRPPPVSSIVPSSAPVSSLVPSASPSRPPRSGQG